jgi:hypothetical protein
MSDTQTQKLTRIEIATYVFVLVIVVIGIILSRIDRQVLEAKYIKEDGLIEWLTVIGFVVGGLVCFRRAFALRRVRPMGFIALTILLGFAFIFIAGEEISWGQRIFRVETPAWMQQHNTQEEMNLHNLKIGDVKVNKLLFSQLAAVVMVLYFAVLMPLYGSKPSLARLVNTMAIPIPKLHQAAACIVMLALVQLLVMSSRRGELAEFGGSFLFTLIVALPSNFATFDPTRNLKSKHRVPAATR